MRRKALFLAILGFSACFFCANAWIAVVVEDDPLVRMPGTQPNQGVTLEGPTRCLNCHADYDTSAVPVDRGALEGVDDGTSGPGPDFLGMFHGGSTGLNLGIGNPNATDLCERCHFPEGWLGGAVRSD